MHTFAKPLTFENMSISFFECLKYLFLLNVMSSLCIAKFYLVYIVLIIAFREINQNNWF